MKRIEFFLVICIIVFDLTTGQGQDFLNLFNQIPRNDIRYNRSQFNNSRGVDFKTNGFGDPKNRPKNPEQNRMTISTSNPGKHFECRGVSATLRKMGREVACKTRPTLVKLIPEPGYFYVPDVVLVDRCGGRCGHESHSCMSIESITTRVIVQRMQIGHSHSPCMELEVEKHIQCTCECSLMPQDCNSRQQYNEDECSCECKNTDEEVECTRLENMYWDSNTCRCSCLIEEEVCNTGLAWVPSICSCAKIMTEKKHKPKNKLGNEIPRY